MSNVNEKKYAVILGARPNFVKAAPFFKEARNHPEFSFTLIHTGQHFDANMCKIFFEEMQIPRPDIQLEMLGEFHTEKIGRMFNSLFKIFSQEKFDGVIVFGDVNSTLAGAVAAARCQLPIIHIEAGLRSHDRRMPEEINRVIVDHLSSLLFTTEESGRNNLIKEGVDESLIKYVGNIMIESMEIFWDKINACEILKSINVNPKDYVLTTIHRQENTDDPVILKQIMEIIKEINTNFKKVIFPLHPGTAKKLRDYGYSQLLDEIIVIEPLGYFEFVKLMAESQGVLTDSGGIQEETTHLGVPCCTIRDNTERPVTCELGSNMLFKINSDSIDKIISHLKRNDFTKKPVPLWDDRVSKRIFESL